MKIFGMKALLATCKPLILLDFHRSFNDTPTRFIRKTAILGGFSALLTIAVLRRFKRQISNRVYEWIMYNKLRKLKKA